METARNSTTSAEADEYVFGAITFRACLVIVWLANFAVRLVYLWQIRRAPFFDILMGDAEAYHAWAREIVDTGNWLGTTPFYQAPLYPYFLAAWYTIAGTDLWWLRIFQLILGATSCLFLALAGRRFFSPMVGLVAGFMLAFYPSAIFFDGLIQKTVLDGFFLSLMLFLLGSITHRPGPPISWLLAGVTVACLALTRENALVFVFLIVPWALIYFPNHSWPKRLQWTGFFLVGIALLLLPMAWRNHHLGGGFSLTTTQFGPNLFIGNNPAANGTYVPLRAGHGSAVYERREAIEIAEEASGHALAASQVSSYWADRTVDYIWHQPISWLRLMAKKLFLTWNAYEVSDTDDQYFAGNWSSLLRVLTALFHFGVVCPLAVAGMVLWTDRRRVWLLYASLAAYSLSVAIFYVFARYRYPLVPILLLFAAAGLVQIICRARQISNRAVVFAAIFAIPAAVLANWPSPVRHNQAPNILYNAGVRKLRQTQPVEATGYFRKALEIDPSFWAAHEALGRALLNLGNPDDAVREFQIALQSAPDSAETHNDLGNAFLALHRLSEATDEYQQAVRFDPGSAAAHNGLGVALAHAGDLDGADREFQRALELKPDFADAKGNHERILRLRTQP